MKNISLIVCLLGLAGFYSCDDFIEPELDDKTVFLIAPPDSLRSSVVTQTFWWDEVDGGETYKVQIVKGTFSYVELFVADSLVATNKFQYSLQPGNYQWRVRAENNGGNTPWSTRTLTIDSTLDLSAQIVALTSPIDNYSVNVTTGTFKWQSLYNADEYRLQVTDTASGSLIVDITQTGTEYNYTLSEGNYIWGVRAQNSLSISLYSTRKLNIDLTAPSAPVLVSPLNNAILIAGANDSLTWLIDPSSVSDSLFIDTDSVFPNPQKFFSSNTYYIITQPAGTYFWKVKSMDQAGNQGAFSAYRKFFLQ